MMQRFAAAVALLAIPVYAQATTVQYHSDEELFALADAVIVGHVWRETVAFEAGMTRSRYEVQIQEALKGPPKVGQYILVQTAGGYSEEAGGGEFVAGSPHPKPGTDVIMFLRTLAPNEYGIVSMALGHYELQYNASMHRFMTHRDVGSMALVRSGPKRDQTIVPEDQLLSEVMTKLRTLSAGQKR